MCAGLEFGAWAEGLCLSASRPPGGSPFSDFLDHAGLVKVQFLRKSAYVEGLLSRVLQFAQDGNELIQDTELDLQWSPRTERVEGPEKNRRAARRRQGDSSNAASPFLFTKVSGSSPSGRRMAFAENPSSRKRGKDLDAAELPAASESNTTTASLAYPLRSLMCSLVRAVPRVATASFESVPPEGQEIHVPFDDDGPTAPTHRFRGCVKPIEDLPLVEESGFRGVHVLGLGIIEHPAAEPENAAPDVEDREHDPVSETIIVAAVFPGDHQPCLEGIFQILAFEKPIHPFQSSGA